MYIHSISADKHRTRHGQSQHGSGGGGRQEPAHVQRTTRMPDSGQRKKQARWAEPARRHWSQTAAGGVQAQGRSTPSRLQTRQQPDCQSGPCRRRQAAALMRTPNRPVGDTIGTADQQHLLPLRRNLTAAEATLDEGGNVLGIELLPDRHPDAHFRHYRDPTMPAVATLAETLDVPSIGRRNLAGHVIHMLGLDRGNGGQSDSNHDSKSHFLHRNHLIK